MLSFFNQKYTLSELFKERVHYDRGGDIPNKFWGKEAVGVLIIARDTGRILLLRRSLQVNEPLTWGIVSGRIDEGDDKHTALKKEVQEEIGVSVDEIYPSYIFKTDNFEFHNYLGFVDKEFIPRLNWENTSYKWCDLDSLPIPLHFGIRKLLENIDIQSEISKKRFDKGGKISQELTLKLESEHKSEAEKNNAKFMNYGWSTDYTGIASKTSKGILDSTINPKTGIVTHEWIVYGFDILLDNKGISRSEDGSAFIKDDDIFELIEIPIEKVRVNKRFTYDWYVNKDLDEDVSIIDWLSDKIKRGEELNPVVLDSNYKMLDGNHRLVAYRKLNVPKIKAYIKVGSRKALKGIKLDESGYTAHIKKARREWLKDTGLSNDAFVWLHNWSWAKGFNEDPSSEVIKEFSKYKPSVDVVLYRGTKDPKETEEKKKYRSFSYELGYAEAVAEVGEFADVESDVFDSTGRVITENVSPDRILVDFTKIPHYKDYFTNEVIVKKKNTEIVEVYTNSGLQFDFDVDKSLTIDEVERVVKEKSKPQGYKWFIYKEQKTTKIK